MVREPIFQRYLWIDFYGRLYRQNSGRLQHNFCHFQKWASMSIKHVFYGLTKTNLGL
jgi:hypothetical protein